MPTMPPEPRYIPNDMPIKTLSSPSNELFIAALESFVEKNSPLQEFKEGDLFGLFGGFTGISCMFLRLSELYPEVKVQDQSLRQLAEIYLPNVAQEEEGFLSHCGLFNERLSQNAVRACLTGQDADVDKFLFDFPAIEADITPGEEEDIYCSELVYGRSGALYLLRLVRYWVPASTEKINAHVDKVADRIMKARNEAEGGWLWENRRYIGAAHGDIGNLAQLVLTTPSIAPKLQAHLQQLLAMQFEDGNWPKIGDGEEKESDIVQFCHGSVGFIFTLRALRPHFPELAQQINNAIAKGQEIAWQKGLLKKTPAICHGILGNAL